MDVRGSPQKTTSLLIKTPSQDQEDRTIDGVCLSWTVGELKTHLSTVYPTRPAVSEQRLIFAGKLLPDHLHLKDLFRQADAVPMLHLVCTVRNSSPPKTPDSHQPPAASPTPVPSPVQTPSAPELRQRRQASPPPAAVHPQSPPSSPGAPAAAAWSEAPQVTPPTFHTSCYRKIS